MEDKNKKIEKINTSIEKSKKGNITKPKAKKITSDVTADKNNKKKKAFTLIELLAVIIILGILMIIAIPSVTMYISDSRKNTYVETAKNLIGSTRNMVNQGKLGMYDMDATYYIPTSCIKTENGADSPYGKFEKSFVVVTYNGKGYDYYWISVDETGQGVRNITPVDKLNIDNIESDITSNEIEEIVNSTGIEERSIILVLNGDCIKWNDEKLATYSVGINGGISTKIKKKVTCEAGKYLPQGSEICNDCPAGSYCTGGTYSVSDSSDQGKELCPIGTYSEATESISCTLCQDGYSTRAAGQKSHYSCYACSNKFGVETWVTQSLVNGEVQNLCKISSCRSVSSGGYFELTNNKCEFTGTMYSHMNYNYGKNTNISDLNFYSYSDAYFAIDELGKCSKFANAKVIVDHNIVQENPELCFRINGNGIRIRGKANPGFYCFKSSNGANSEETYQYNVNILKSIFGVNDSRCTETDTEYKCRVTEYNNDSIFIVYKNGEVYVDYDDPDSDYSCYANPHCIIDVNKFIKCPGSGCLSGDTEVDVYDRKKKRRFRKKLRDVTCDDLILCWDFDKCEFTYVEPLWIKKAETLNRYYLLKFSDGSKLKVIGDHKVFDVDKNKFVNAGADNELKIGSRVYNSNGEFVELVSWEVIEDTIDSYNVITNYHMNMFANGILTSCVLSNIYEIKDMKYVDNSTERLSNKELKKISEKYIKGLRLNEVPSNFRGSKEDTIKYINDYVQKLISKEK